MKKFILSVMLVVATAVAFAADPPRAKTKCGPWVVGVTETEMTVVWTSTERCMGWVEVAPDDGSHFYAVQRPRYDEDFMGRHVVSDVHHVRITGLKPGTNYRYRIYQQGVDDSGHNPVPSGYISASTVYKRDPYAIRTMNSKKQDCTFTMINDIHGRDSMMLALTKDIRAQKPDFVVFNGDMVSFMGSTEDIEKGFMTRATETFATDVPLVYVRGNHETRGKCALKFSDYFPTTTGKPYYTFTHGNTFFIALDGGEDKPDSNIEYYETAAYDAYRKEEAEWLRKVVESEECKSAKRRIVLLHMPPVDGHKMWHGTKQIRELFIPILNKANISVMLCGHVHKYSFHDDQAAFPIVVNSFEDALKVKVDNGGVKVDVVGMDGAVKHTHSFK